MTLFRFFDALIALERQRNETLAEIDAELVAVVGRAYGAVRELKRIADATERIAAALTEDRAGGDAVGIRIGPTLDDPADHGGERTMSLVLVIPDDKMILVDLPLPLADRGGNPILGPDGAPWPATGWNVTSDDPAVALITANDGSAGEGFPPAGSGFWIRGRALGQSTCHVNVPLPDAPDWIIDLLVNVVASGPQESAVAIGMPIDDPNPTA